jgi:probable phosphoglycerate mutase
MTTDSTDPHPTRILLVRHGQSVANAGGIPTDHIANPLTELGHAQAKAFADGISCEPTLYLISSYQRAQQTSVPLRQRYPEVPIEEWPIHEFHYLNPAQHNGTSEEQQILRTPTGMGLNRSAIFSDVPAAPSNGLPN